MNEIERLTVERDEARLAARNLAFEIRCALRHIDHTGLLARGCSRVDDLRGSLRKYEALKIIEPS